MEMTVHDAQVRKTLGLLMMVIVTAGMAWILTTHLPALFFGESSQNWPTTTAVVLRTDVREIKQERNYPYHTPRLTYEYWVDGKRFEGNRFRFQDKSIEKEFGGVDKFREQFSPGTKVKAFFQPGDPSVSVLFPGGQQTRLALTLAVLVGLGALSLLVIFALLRDRKKMNAIISSGAARQT